MKFIGVFAVCDTPVDPLWTLIILRFSNTSKTFNFSEPIKILLPTDTFIGIWVI